MGEVKNIADANYGITPHLLKHIQQFEAEVWESIADATKQGVPLCVVIGILAIAQSEVINVGVAIEVEDDPAE